MKKLIIGLAIASALGLSACDDETIKDIENENEAQAPALAVSRVAFDPGADEPVISVPNDLLFSGHTDGTLNFDSAVPDTTDFSNPRVALSALDGWSTHQPFVLAFDFDEGVSLDPAGIFNSDAVTMYEAVMGADLNDAECNPVPAGIACKGVKQMVLGEDFIVQAFGSDLAIIPMKPLKAKTTYIIALTKNLTDTNGDAILGSSTYETVRQDVNTKPLADPDQFTLQNLINSYENIAEGFGLDRDNITYTMAMTTQSINDVLGVAKQLILADLASPATAAHIGVQNMGFTAADALALNPEDPTTLMFAAADIYGGTVNNVRYYGGVPTEENQTAPLNQHWKAACDSGVTLAGLAQSNPDLIPEGPVSVNDGYCMAFGLRDIGVDAERNLTKFNPVPALVEHQNLEVLMAIPDETDVNITRTLFGMDPITKPENGWPVVMFQHGFGRSKEDMLALSGVLAINGFAVASLDQPLHGSRGYGAISASLNPAVYLNLESLLTVRDNLRQSVADTLAFRAALNTVYDAEGPFAEIDGTNVYYAGQSLGSITGHNFMALTNTSLGGDKAVYDPMFKVKAAALSVPGAGMANFLFNSPAFGSFVKGSLVYASSTDFQNFVQAYGFEDDLSAGWDAFVPNLTAEQLAAFNSSFADFMFAAQSVTDSGDPLSYTSMLASNDSNILIHSVVGNGMDSLEDQVIPAATPSSPLAGFNPLIDLLGLEVTSDMLVDENGVSGAVKFVNGNHGSLLDPNDRPESINEAAVTTEMQSQIATYFISEGTAIIVSESDLVLK
ncbi:hypothetical protein A9Q98_00900 [Thalassotalea sp. 42_200_T64]|nr:hypothetical protein A9Q98_00900 [Thalassotalea sp. 42_200_T64]